MTSKRFIDGEIRLMLAELIDAGRICDVDLLCTEYLGRKAPPEGDDADFYLVCADDFLRRNLRGLIGKLQPKSTTEIELAFDGFDHMQKAYPVMRDGRQVIVPTQLLTDEEIDDRAWELDAMAVGCTAHANELREYKRRRGNRESA